MKGLIQKSGYIKSGSAGAGNYMSYIATRDGVELLTDKGRQESDKYMKYIAERPRSHGLFSSTVDTSLTKTMAEVNDHPGPVWTFVFSLKREDATRLGYDNAASWQRLIKAHQAELAESMKIPPSQFRWCAAFHDEKHHPHIHMMVWSADPKHGYLTEKGIEKMRSKLNNDIFQDEMLSLYQQKDIAYHEVVAASREAMGKLIRQMKSSICDSPAVAQKVAALAEMLKDAKGKKVYGYLKKPAKAQVDAIVDELAQLPAVAECYEAWNHLRDAVDGYYKDTPREWLPLSQQKEFKAIKNAVIREAENIYAGKFSFEDERMADEVDEDAKMLSEQSSNYQLAGIYQDAKNILYSDESTETEKEIAVQTLERLWDAGFNVVAHQLGKCWRDGLGVLPDDEQAEIWFRRSAEAGYDFSQYTLAKFLQNDKRITEAAGWYEKAALQGNPYAAYQLSKLYLTGEGVPKDIEKAAQFLRTSAQAGNQYAQYALGKLYLAGQELPRDQDQAGYWLTKSATQENEYAQFLLCHMNQTSNPNLLLSATKLLQHMGNIFQDNSVPPVNPAGQHMDRKLRRQIREKKIAAGHKPDDHEEQGYIGLAL